MNAVLQKPVAYCQMAIAILLFGTSLPVSQVLTREIGVFEGTAIRLTVASVLFLPILWRHRDEIAKITSIDAILVILIGASLIAVSGLMLGSTRFVPCSVICTVTCLTPVVTGLGAMLFVRDRPHPGQLGWILFAACCALFIRSTCAQSDSQNCESMMLVFGVALSCVAVICEASGILMAKVVTRRLNPLPLAALSTLASVVLILPATLISSGYVDLTGLTANAWLAVFWWGAGGIWAGTWLWYSGIQQTSATTAAVFLSTLPFVTIAMSWVLN
ncbi:EamA-like transporter family protein [Thalassoglobus neptunius]|uniref:EamA-like transporter family protein n=1 Tax=Thalassoglobus neptunius TaxID=1938619 RepID=A0A5C5VB04_9PLAN|nr:DMT family transporter [Thalassoglobus neptunius]TWT35039.1 EamA-like transporter family protein [Thalassoglobus neptunius]